MERKTLWFLFMLFLLLAADIAVKTAEGRRCESKSHKFKGPCSRDSNCASVCRGEGFTGGDCRGFRRRCFCTRNC
ncbi:putative oxidoreductase [Medicago truncatula]|uniref:Defensin MtDef4.6 n=1 Tax=Medicago truncatula TaxID=3880 RepID=G7LGG9_MEDTR|nr:defensin-like protein 1 [Medicago truncatula]AET04897.1 Defensin MtDef4.6 [Medicago truncatula]RHN43207.1 putative oxidoreductase [Medicago truncatula]